jgi:His/Glu/Gln/Arg/opine family amino acid ABC transporter permease subunit
MHFDVHVFLETLFSRVFLLPVLTTLGVTLAAMAIGITLGFAGALGALSRFAPLRAAVGLYVGVFRGVPALVQIVFWYDAVAEVTDNAINLPALLAGVIALGMNEGAYMTEIIRAGLISVDPGQRDAARALGMTAPVAMRRIIVPQALRIIVPPTGNQFISMLKTTSLLFTIAVPEIFARGTQIYSQNFKYFEVLCVMSIWYLLLTGALTAAQQVIERRFGIGDAGRAARGRAFSRACSASACRSGASDGACRNPRCAQAPRHARRAEGGHPRCRGGSGGLRAGRQRQWEDHASALHQSP